jgi:hypothetical protein
VNTAAAALHHDAVCAYLDREFMAAVQLLEREAAVLPKADEPVKLLLSRCVASERASVCACWHACIGVRA